MKGFATFFKQKQVAIALVAVMVAVTILSFANLGSTVNPQPHNMPVALVMEDQGATLPNGKQLNFGELIQEKLTVATTPTGEPSPFTWTVLDSQEAALDALDHEEYYGALVIPADLTKRLASLQSKTPLSAEVQVYLNQGKNFTAATMVGTALDKMIIGINQQLRTRMLTDIQVRGGDQLNTAQASALATPIVAVVNQVNTVGSNSANGNGPVMLTTLMWMSAMAGTVLLFIASGKVQAGRFGAKIGQLLGGMVVAMVASATSLLVTHGLLDLNVPDLWKTGLVLAFICYCFFLMQTMVVSWLGFAGMPLFILLFFFGGPVLGMPPEFLPAVTRDWLLSWIPLRFAVEALRDTLYFGQGLNMMQPVWVLTWIALGSIVLTLASLLKKRSSNMQQQEQALVAE